MRTTFKAKKTTLLLFSVAVLLAGGAAAVRGQSALDGFDPNANGSINVVVVQPDPDQQCPCNRDTGGRKYFGWRRFHNNRRTDAQLYRPTRCHDRPGRFVRPEREQ